MSSIYFTLTLIAFICCGIFLITSIFMFILFRIPTVVKDLRGSLEKKQIEEIRVKNTDKSARKGSVNVFEELQQKAKPRNNNTQRIKVSDTTGSNSYSNNEPEGTSVLKKSPQVINGNFRIEKNIIFVSTTDILR